MELLRKSMTIDVAHELRTPLTKIQGYLEALIDGVLSASKETCELLLEETLRLAEADAARADLQKEKILLKTLIEREIDSFRSRFDQKGIGIEIKHDSEEVTTHSKLVIIDGKTVILGSTNWSYYGLEKNHEANVLIRSKEIADYFEKYFDELWIK